MDIYTDVYNIHTVFTRLIKYDELIRGIIFFGGFLCNLLSTIFYFIEGIRNKKWININILNALMSGINSIVHTLYLFSIAIS